MSKITTSKQTIQNQKTGSIKHTAAVRPTTAIKRAYETIQTTLEQTPAANGEAVSATSNERAESKGWLEE